MIVIALCAVLAVAIATLAIGTHRSRQYPGSHRETEHEGWTSAEEIRELGDAPPTPHPAAWEPVMAAPTAGQPPWDWAGGEGLRPGPIARMFLPPQTITEEEPCASGNGPVTVAEPLAPLPPAAWPAAPSASAPDYARSAACTGPASAPATPAPPAGDALTLLDERQALIERSRAILGATPATVTAILGHDTVDAAIESSYTRAMAQQVREMAAADA